MQSHFEYDVAFSFLHQDEGLAYEINDLIQDRYKTFIYSRHQEELAGSDGEIKFNEIFGIKSRIVIILHRESWGKTSWTRIEENAIRNRGHEEGYDFSTFVQLIPGTKLPIWLPKSRIYTDFDRWGKQGLASIIEFKIKEAGGNDKPEGVEDRIERLKRDVIAKEKRMRFLSSPEGFSKSREELTCLYDLLDNKFKFLQSANTRLRWQMESHRNDSYIIRCGKNGIHFKWDAYSNSLKDSNLNITLTHSKRNGARAVFNGDYRYFESAVKEVKYIFDYESSTNKLGWSMHSTINSFISTEKLVEDWLKSFFDLISESEPVDNR